MFYGIKDRNVFAKYDFENLILHIQVFIFACSQDAEIEKGPTFRV